MKELESETMVDWDEVETIFSDAVELPAGGREGFLTAACGVGTPVRREVDILLQAFETGHPLFERIGADLSGARTKPLFSAGDRIANRFHIIRFLSRGGTGEVYEARDDEVGEAVALKVIYSAGFDPDAVERLQTEVRLARKIQSPRVCRVHDVGRTAAGGVEFVFLSMELIRGETLAEYLKTKSPLPWKSAWPLIADIIEGLQAAHSAGVLHCDLKPGNVMLASGASGIPRAVLTDFGLAQTLQTGVDGGPSALLAGTPYYMAPERLDGGASSVASDIYSLGVLAHQVLTGAFPVANDGPVSANLDSRRRKAIQKCLHAQPGKRYKTVEDFRRAIADPGGRTRRAALFALPAIAAGAAALTSAQVRTRLRLLGSAPNSIAVLPFSAATADVRYVSEGIGAEIGDALSRVPGLRLIARGSAKSYTADPANFESIARDLVVRTIVCGETVRIPDGFRLAVRIIDIASGAIVWSETYDVRESELTNVSPTVVRAAIHSLPLRFAPEDAVRFRLGAVTNPEAYGSYLLGRFFGSKRDSASLSESIACYRRALEADPSSSPVHSGLAIAYNLIASKGVMPRPRAFELSDESANQALQLDPASPEAHIALASNFQMFHWKWEDSRKHFEAACAGAPSSALAHHWYAGLLSMLSRHDEALREIAIAQDLDPMSLAVSTARGAFLYRAGRIPEAIELLRWTLTRDRSFLNAEIVLADVLISAGKGSEALHAAESAAAKSNRLSFTISTLARAHLATGGSSEAARLVVELEARHAQGKASASDIAQVYRDMRNFDKAFHWLAIGLEAHEAGLTVLKCEPSYAILRHDPRYDRLVADLQL